MNNFKQRCGNCNAFEPSPQQIGKGFCRRNEGYPVVISQPQRDIKQGGMVLAQMIQSVNPFKDAATDWCRDGWQLDMSKLIESQVPEEVKALPKLPFPTEEERNK